MSKFLTVAILSTFFISSVTSQEVFAKPHKAKQKKYSESQIERIITSAAHKADVPPHLLLAICWIETSYVQPKIPEPLDGKTPSYGICQVKLETAQFMDKTFRLRMSASVTRLRDPYVNAFYAAKYLKYQLKQYNGDWKKSVAAYNQGSWDESSPNVTYVSKIEKAIEIRGLASY
jgi:soluble lytic murein transglycosylase-like protein